MKPTPIPESAASVAAREAACAKVAAKSKAYDLPPSEFSNAMNKIKPDFDFRNWRQSPEWRICVAGYNSAVRGAADSVAAHLNMGQRPERLFGE